VTRRTVASSKSWSGPGASAARDTSSLEEILRGPGRGAGDGATRRLRRGLVERKCGPVREGRDVRIETCSSRVSAKLDGVGVCIITTPLWV
jgi:hypothetical protein